MQSKPPSFEDENTAKYVSGREILMQYYFFHPMKLY